MQNIVVTTKTSDQIAADFEDAFADIKHRRKTRPGSLATGLAPHRQAILRHRRRGLTWTEIAAIVAAPPINKTATAKVLQKLFGCRRKSVAMETRR